MCRSSNRLYVGDIAPEANESDVQEHFREYKPVDVNLRTGFAFVEFANEIDAGVRVQRNFNRLAVGSRMIFVTCPLTYVLASFYAAGRPEGQGCLQFLQPPLACRVFTAEKR